MDLNNVMSVCVCKLSCIYGHVAKRVALKLQEIKAHSRLEIMSVVNKCGDVHCGWSPWFLYIVWCKISFCCSGWDHNNVMWDSQYYAEHSSHFDWILLNIVMTSIIQLEIIFGTCICVQPKMKKTFSLWGPSYTLTFVHTQLHITFELEIYPEFGMLRWRVDGFHAYDMPCRFG